MIKLDDKTYIQADVIDVLKAIRSEAAKKDIQVFQKFRSTSNDVMTNCPFHKQGQEKKPSFGVNGELNKCHCFTCGWVGNIAEMTSYVLGKYDDGEYGKKWLYKKFNTVSVLKRKNILENRLDRKAGMKVSCNIIEEPEYLTWHDYLAKRGFTKQDSEPGGILDKFEVSYNPDNKTICFPVWDEKGDLVFIAERSVVSKFFMVPDSAYKPVYGAHLFTGGKYKTAYITESFFNCLTLWKLGLPAMALMGTGGYKQYPILNKLPVREYILALDPDDGGKLGTQRFRKNVNKIIKEVVYTEPDKDVNDLGKKFLDLDVVF